jgi:hypothetical protein
MKRRPIQNYLIIAISCFILISLVYLRFSNFSEVNAFPADLNFENADQDYQFDDHKQESHGFLLAVFSIEFLPGVSLFEQSYHLFFPVPSFDKDTFVPRC